MCGTLCFCDNVTQLLLVKQYVLIALGILSPCEWLTIQHYVSSEFDFNHTLIETVGFTFYDDVVEIIYISMKFLYLEKKLFTISLLVYD